MTGLATLRAAARGAHLDIFGAFYATPEDDLPAGTRTLVLLGPHEPGFWPAVAAAPEFRDGAPDPLDRWSRRVIGDLAAATGAAALFPFGGPPYRPFIRWAERSGRAWPSPVGLLVHDRAGLFVSYRGALALTERLNLPPPPAAPPCAACETKPCLGACPVGALGGSGGYRLDACHAHLDTGPGADCMTQGCAVRRGCPVSESYGRLAAQSAFHMAAFHKG